MNACGMERDVRLYMVSTTCVYLRKINYYKGLITNSMPLRQRHKRGYMEIEIQILIKAMYMLEI